MSDRFGMVFGSVLAVILLLLYAVSAWAMIYAIWVACPGQGCGQPLAEQFSDGFRFVLTTVGGLVSALVISRLSITAPGSALGFRTFEEISDRLRLILNWVSAIYLLVWALTGLAALIVGVMLYPDVIPTVSDLGTVWLGLAVAAGYAYFGLSPSEGKPREKSRETDPRLNTRTSIESNTTIAALEAQIASGRILFDAGKPTLKAELLGQNTGQKVTKKLQTLVLRLSEISDRPIRVSSLVRTGSNHGLARAVDIGNEEIAGVLLPKIVPLVGELEIDQIIFDATVAGESDRNQWNHLAGVRHPYSSATLNDHKDHIHFAVLD